jgi:hypothetical protein
MAQFWRWRCSLGPLTAASASISFWPVGPPAQCGKKRKLEGVACPPSAPQLSQSNSEALRDALRAGDPAASLNAAAMQRLIQSIGAAGFRAWPPLLGGEKVPSELCDPNPTCGRCGQLMSLSRGLSTTAALLDSGGVIVKNHIPLRCRTRGSVGNGAEGCEYEGALVWHNYCVSHGKHLYRGDPYVQECFMLTASFGFTKKYLEELHLRMRQHVSFAGEAFVQQERAAAAGMDQHLPVGRLRQYLSDGWFKWRLVRRVAALSDRGFSSMCPQRVDLREATDVCLKPFWTDMLHHFEHDAVEAARKRNANTRVVAVDGNQKNRRTCCSAPFQQHLRNESLHKCLRLPCPHTPKLGSSFCRKHNDWEDDVLEKTGVEIISHKIPGPALTGGVDTILFKVAKTLPAADGDGEPEEVWTSEADLHPHLGRI